MKERILVTGGAGYIGSHTVVELLNRGYDIVVIDNLFNASQEALKRVEKITGKSVKFYENDLRDQAALEKVFTENHIDSILHFAGMKAVGESVVKPLVYYDNNVGGTISLLEAALRHGVKKIVFSSSATVYGDPERLPIDENCRLMTTNPYGTTKLMIESILTDVAKANKDLTVVLLRYFNPVGAHPSGLIGEDPKGIPNNLTPYIAQVASGKLPFVHVYGNDYKTPDGTGVRDYIHVLDLAVGHVLAIEKVTKPGVFVYNLGTGKGYSVLEVIHSFEKACGKKLPYLIEPRRPGDIDASFADVKKAQKELGFIATRGIDEMCASLWTWQSKNPEGYGTK